MRKQVVTILLTALAALPGLIVRVSGLELQPPVMALLSGISILAASFVLLWACDAAQSEVSQAVALAVVALIAVLPEYSVDMYFTWQAGKYPASNYAHYAIANMTGANRLLIGVAWALIATLFWLRFRRDVELEDSRRMELFFLGLATAYAFLIPLKGTLAWYDGVVFLGIYVWYLVVAARRPVEEVEPEGPAELFARLPKTQRRLAILAAFLFAGCAILASAEPFCEGLVATGKMFRINEFLLVQWLAPLASEAPEFTVALVFAWRGQASMALGSLLSAKLNQWTLLVGMIPGAFAISHGTLEHPLPMSSGQMSELLLTAAQSLFAVVLLAGLRLSIGNAILLFGLFIGQFILPLFSPMFPGLAFGLDARQIHPVFSIVYCAVAAALFLQQPKQVLKLAGGWESDTEKSEQFSEEEIAVLR
ncbi:MAG: sodium:calcium antiporter [Bryobacteraceae bacterium]